MTPVFAKSSAKVMVLGRNQRQVHQGKSGTRWWQLERQKRLQLSIWWSDQRMWGYVIRARVKLRIKGMLDGEQKELHFFTMVTRDNQGDGFGFVCDRD